MSRSSQAAVCEEGGVRGVVSERYWDVVWMGGERHHNE